MANGKENSSFWQSLNAASLALQQAAQSETAVYQVFSEQLVKLGLQGSVNLLDETGQNLRVTSLVFSERMMRFVKLGERRMRVTGLGFTYPVDASSADEAVLRTGEAVFLPDNSERIRLVVSQRIYRAITSLLKYFQNMPAILAPLFAKSEVIGVLYVAGSDLRPEDVPAIAAFATHLSIALENARLFQAVQRAEAQYRRLFESANDGIFLFDQRTRQLISANPKMLSLLGIKEQDVGKVRPSTWAPPNIYQLYAENLQCILEKGSHFFEVPYINEEGDTRHWQISANITELEGRPVINGLVRDITEARRSEEALRQREEQFRILAENVPGTIYLCKNEPRFPLLYVNDGVETLTGYAKEMFLNEQIFYVDLVYPQDRPNIDRILTPEEVAANQSYHFVYRVQHRSGRWRWVEETGAGVFDDDGNLLFLEGVITDITQRVEADLLQKTVYNIAAVAHTDISLDELYHSIHKALALLLNVQNFYIALYDKASDMISVPYFVDKYDTSPTEQELGRGLTAFVIRSNASKLLTHEQINAHIQEGKVSLRGTMPQVWLGVPLRSQGEAIGVLAVQSYEESTAYSEQDSQFLTFVSEQIASVINRKQAEERQQQLSAELTKQTRLLEAILAATPDNFLVFNLDGRLQFVSTNILEFLDLSIEAVVGKTWQELQMPAEFGEASDEGRATVLRTGEPVSREFHYPLPDGVREIEFIITPVFDDEGSVASFVSTVRDVTERRQTMRAMHRAQKMESLGILAGGIAHDFNNLLVAMLGQASLAQAYLEPNNRAYTHVNKVVQAAEQAANLTQQLLAYSGGGQFTTQAVHLNTLIQESTDLLKVALPKQVVLELDLAADLPPTEADTGQLQQVIMNLLINAAEAIGDRVGRIRLQTAVRCVTEKDALYWRYTDQPLAPGSYISLQVADNGDGMDQENIAKIFDPFFTTKFTGRGLGLAAVLGIVRGHHGGLSVLSEPQVGTVFELLLPAAPDTQLQASAHQTEPEAETAVAGVVLVIDDEKAVRNAVVDILELEGLRALTAANGDEGIALYKSHADEIGLVLLDLSMPGKSGRETFEALQQFDPNVRILLSSGFSEADATQGLASPSLVGFLQKPYRLNTLVQQLHKTLNTK